MLAEVSSGIYVNSQSNIQIPHRREELDGKHRQKSTVWHLAEGFKGSARGIPQWGPRVVQKAAVAGHCTQSVNPISYLKASPMANSV